MTALPDLARRHEARTRMTKPPALQRFTRAVAVAHNLNPHRLALHILADSAERRSTLKAATYEAKVSVGGRGESLPERMLELVHNVLPVDRDNFIALDRAVVKALDAVSILNAECHDRGAHWDSDAWRHDDWHQMLHSADTLNEPIHPDSCQHHRSCQATQCHNTCPRKTCACRSLIGDALAVDRDIHGSLHAFANAVGAITGIRRKYSRRAPTKWQQLAEDGLTPERLCDVCSSISPPEYHAWVYRDRQCCRWAYRLWLRNGERPPQHIVELRWRGSTMDYRKELSKWEADCERRRRGSLTQQVASS